MLLTVVPDGKSTYGSSRKLDTDIAWPNLDGWLFSLVNAGLLAGDQAVGLAQPASLDRAPKSPGHLIEDARVR